MLEDHLRDEIERLSQGIYADLKLPPPPPLPLPSSDESLNAEVSSAAAAAKEKPRATEKLPSVTVTLEDSNREPYVEMSDRIIAAQLTYLMELRQMFKLSFVCVQCKDDLPRSGLIIGSVLLLGWPLQDIPSIKMKTMDLDTVLTANKQLDATLGGCCLICDVLINCCRLLKPLNADQPRLRILQRRGQYYFCPSTDKEIPMVLPLDRKALIVGSEFYNQILSLLIQFAQYKHNYLTTNRFPTRFALPSRSLDIFVQLGHLFNENV